jgi:hypothetical protein
MTSEYPKTWKISKVTPIAKVNKVVNKVAISKGFEIIMRRQITEDVEQKGLLSSHQSVIIIKVVY